MQNMMPTNTTAKPRGSCTPTDGKPTFITDDVSLVAVLTHQNAATAVLSFSVGELQQSNNRVQLLPDGQFKSKDGRPGSDVESGSWLMDAQAFATLKTNAANRENDFHFDYEHQTMYSDENGQPAIASGWFNPANLEYVPGEGLFAANVNWTPKAAKHIADKEYRYVSAVFSYDKKTGRPINFMHAALTNDPALDGMKAIAALKNQSQLNNSNTKPTGDNSMNEAMRRLLKKLGIAINDADFADAAALKQVEDKAIVALKALVEKAEKSGQLEKELNTAQASVVALKAKSDGEVDLSKYVHIGAYNAQTEQLVALKATIDTGSVEQLLKDNADKFVAAEAEYLTSFGHQQGVAALKQMLEIRPAMAALKTTQTEGKTKSESGGSGETLSAEQIAVCKNIGLSQDEFKAQLAKETGEQ